MTTNFVSSTNILFSQDHHAVEVSGLVWRRFGFFLFWVVVGSSRKWSHSLGDDCVRSFSSRFCCWLCLENVRGVLSACLRLLGWVRLRATLRGFREWLLPPLPRLAKSCHVVMIPSDLLSRRDDHGQRCQIHQHSACLNRQVMQWVASGRIGDISVSTTAWS